jgi:hypothetical protein
MIFAIRWSPGAEQRRGIEYIESEADGKPGSYDAICEVAILQTEMIHATFISSWEICYPGQAVSNSILAKKDSAASMCAY